jgi:threonine 3-dehydrogenase
MYIDDCVRAIVEFMEAPNESLKIRTYNIGACSFGPDEVFDEIKKHIPNAKMTYKIDARQAIGIFLAKIKEKI